MFSIVDGAFGIALVFYCFLFCGKGRYHSSLHFVTHWKIRFNNCFWPLSNYLCL